MFEAYAARFHLGELKVTKRKRVLSVGRPRMQGGSGDISQAGLVSGFIRSFIRTPSHLQCNSRIDCYEMHSIGAPRPLGAIWPQSSSQSF